jgi:hypothetical protein
MEGWRFGLLQPPHDRSTADGSGQLACRPFTAARPTQVSSRHNGRGGGMVRYSRLMTALQQVAAARASNIMLGAVSIIGA